MLNIQRDSGVRLPPRSAWPTKFRFRSAFLAAAALALVAGGASATPEVVGHTGKIRLVFHKAKGAKFLYYQNSNPVGVQIDSQNFTSGISPQYNDSGADDFVVPKGETWTVKYVDVTGVYFDYSNGPAASENVIFYKDRKSMPGKSVKGGTFDDLNCIDHFGSFSCSLGKGVKLKSGHYWLAVVANCSGVGACYEWGWEMSTIIHTDPAMWENPGGGFGYCSTWGTLDSCVGYNSDLLFDLRGRAKKS